MTSDQLRKLGARSGAWSIATGREVYDSQITLTGEEQILVESHFKGDIHVGNVRSDPAAASKVFRRHAVGAPIKLNLVYPKPSKGELRLYLRQMSFKPRADDVWFLYLKDEAIFVGSMKLRDWENLGES